MTHFICSILDEGDKLLVAFLTDGRFRLLGFSVELVTMFCIQANSIPAFYSTDLFVALAGHFNHSFAIAMTISVPPPDPLMLCSENWEIVQKNLSENKHFPPPKRASQFLAILACFFSW